MTFIIWLVVQSIWKILVKLDHFPRDPGWKVETTTYLCSKMPYSKAPGLRLYVSVAMPGSVCPSSLSRPWIRTDGCGSDPHITSGELSYWMSWMSQNIAEYSWEASSVGGRWYLLSTRPPGLSRTYPVVKVFIVRRYSTYRFRTSSHHPCHQEAM